MRNRRKRNGIEKEKQLNYVQPIFDKCWLDIKRFLSLGKRIRDPDDIYLYNIEEQPKLVINGRTSLYTPDNVDDDKNQLEIERTLVKNAFSKKIKKIGGIEFKCESALKDALYHEITHDFQTILYRPDTWNRASEGLAIFATTKQLLDESKDDRDYTLTLIADCLNKVKNKEKYTTLFSKAFNLSSEDLEVIRQKSAMIDYKPLEEEIIEPGYAIGFFETCERLKNCRKKRSKKNKALFKKPFSNLEADANHVPEILPYIFHKLQKILGVNSEQPEVLFNKEQLGQKLMEQPILARRTWGIELGKALYFSDPALHKVSEELAYNLLGGLKENGRDKMDFDAAMPNIVKIGFGYLLSQFIDSERDFRESIDEIGKRNGETPFYKEARDQIKNGRTLNSICHEITANSFKDRSKEIEKTDRYILGYNLGDKMYRDFAKGKLSLEEIRKIYSNKYEGDNASNEAFTDYINLILK